MPFQKLLKTNNKKSQIHSDLKGKGMKINPLTDYYKSVFSVLLRGIINNPSVSTQFSYSPTSCKNVETLSRKSNLSCFKSLLVTGP